jgi:hypothetical protein
MTDTTIEASKRWYIAVWQAVLTNLLRWSPEAVNELVAYWTSGELADCPGFYHETPIYYLRPKLIPKRLRETLSENDWWRLGTAIETALFEQSDKLGEDGYDWPAAREKINALLAEYGHTLP